MFRLVVEIHLSDNGSLYWEKLQWHAPGPILRMSVNGVSMIFSFTSWVIYVPIGCRHPFMRYWLPLVAKARGRGSLPHPENECQRSVNRFSCCIIGNQGIAQIFAFITELLTALLGNTTIYQSKTPIPNQSILQAAKHAITYYWLLKMWLW